MNLVQKLPVGLSLGLLMLLSSCSQEEAAQPAPELEQITNEAGAGFSADKIIALPSFPHTTGATGNGSYATHWERNVQMPDDPQLLPTGTSSFSHLWGNPAQPWAVPLPAIPGISNTATIATITTNAANWNGGGQKSFVKTKIKYLKPGAKYAITFRVATTSFNGQLLPYAAAYAKEVMAVLSHSTGAFATYIDLTGKPATWVEKTIVFTANEPQMTFSFTGITANPGEYAYANILVDKGAIKEVN